MPNENATPFRAQDYDKQAKSTIPFYEEFYAQTISVVREQGYPSIQWLDLGCGTGTLKGRAEEAFEKVCFTMVDPCEQMLELAKAKCPDGQARYLCAASSEIAYEEEFQVATAILSHHYMKRAEREAATHKVYRALKKNGVYITFENIVPASAEVKRRELARWGSYQRAQGKPEEDVAAHLSRCGDQYFPLTIEQHVALLRAVGFRVIHVFWLSYMQMGIYAIK